MQLKNIRELTGWPARAYLLFLARYFERLAPRLEGPDGIYEDPSNRALAISKAITQLANDSGFPKEDTFKIPSVGRYIPPYRPMAAKFLADVIGGFLGVAAFVDYLDDLRPVIALPGFEECWYARAFLPLEWVNGREERNSIALLWKDDGGNYSSYVFDNIGRRARSYDETKPGVVLKTAGSQGHFVVFKFGQWGGFYVVPEENQPYIVNLDQPGDVRYFPESMRLPPKH